MNCLLNKHLIFQIILSLARPLARSGCGVSIQCSHDTVRFSLCCKICSYEMRIAFFNNVAKGRIKGAHEQRMKKKTKRANMYAITTKSGIKHLTGASDALSFSSNTRLAQRFHIVTSKFHYIDFVSMARYSTLTPTARNCQCFKNDPQTSASEPNHALNSIFVADFI